LAHAEGREREEEPINNKTEEGSQYLFKARRKEVLLTFKREEKGTGTKEKDSSAEKGGKGHYSKTGRERLLFLL